MTNKEFHLVKLLEECSEVIHMCSKSLRFGIDERKDEVSETNKDKLTQEMIEVIAAVELAQEHGVIGKMCPSKILDAKKRILKYKKVSQIKGRVE